MVCLEVQVRSLGVVWCESQLMLELAASAGDWPTYGPGRKLDFLLGGQECCAGWWLLEAHGEC